MVAAASGEGLRQLVDLVRPISADIDGRVPLSSRQARAVGVAVAEDLGNARNVAYRSAASMEDTDLMTTPGGLLGDGPTHEPGTADQQNAHGASLDHPLGPLTPSTAGSDEEGVPRREASPMRLLAAGIPLTLLLDLLNINSTDQITSDQISPDQADFDPSTEG